MSEVIDNLEELDNKTLHSKCLEFGLPNIPVTNTSRNLLIKKLRAAMQGGEKSAVKAKSRRETVHIIKVDVEGSKESESKKVKDVKDKKAASRKTIIGTISTPTYEESPVKHTTVTQRRRSGRTTPISQLDPVPSYATKRKAEAIEESTEDEGHFLPMEEKRQEEARKSRSPSLSKSPTVTTSYVRDSGPEIIELDDDDDDDDDEIEEVRDEEVVQPRYTVSSSRSYETSSIPLKQKEFSSKYITTSKTTNKPFTPAQTFLTKAPTSTYSYDSSTKQRYSSRQYVEHTPDKVMKSGYTSTISADVDEENDESEAPYLSDFARRLSYLKADTLDSGISSPMKREMSQKKEIPRYYPTTIAGRRGISSHESVGDR